MKRLCVIAAALCAAGAAFAAPGFAAEDIMSGFYGNTLVITDQSGVQKWHYKPDHTLFANMQDGKRITGTWLVNEGRLCETPEGEGSVCYQMGAKKVGDKWTGRPGMTLEVVSGTQ